LLLPSEVLHRVSHLTAQHDVLKGQTGRLPPPARRSPLLDRLIPLPGRLIPLPGRLNAARHGYGPGLAVPGTGDGVLRPVREPFQRQPGRSEQPVKQRFPCAGGLLALIGERLARIGGPFP
jgi:hypothetical protein